MQAEHNIERKILIASLTSQDYLKRTREEIQPNLMKSEMASMLMILALDFYDTHGIPAKNNIDDIYFEKVKTGIIPKALAEEIEQDILPGLSEEFIAEGVDVEYMVPATIKYFKGLKLQKIKNEIDILLEQGEIEEAENRIIHYKSTQEDTSSLILNKPEVKEAVRKAFESVYEPILEYSGALGKFWNNQMTRGSFVAFLSPEKRGKTMLLMDAVLRGAKQGKKVALFQAGDMSEAQMLRRMVLNLSKKTDREDYAGKQYIPVKDCIRNQLNLCSKELRESVSGALEHKGWDENEIRKEINYEDIVDAYKTDREYKVCYNCSDFNKIHLGSVFVTREDIKLITPKQAEAVVEKWFIKNNRQVRMSTHPNDSLSVSGMKQILNTWEAKDGFIPDIIVVDYADLLLPSTKMEFRHQQNQIWKELRGLNQELNCLLITATQSDAKSYEKDTLSLANFSEDKRKFAHCTFFAGLNMDTKGREKRLGILRINELIARESSFDAGKQVYVLQDLNRAIPILTSYF